MCSGGELQKDLNTSWRHKLFLHKNSIGDYLFHIFVLGILPSFPAIKIGVEGIHALFDAFFFYTKVFTGRLEIRFFGMVLFSGFCFVNLISFLCTYATLSNFGKSHLRDFCRQHINPSFINSTSSTWMHSGAFFCPEMKWFWIGKKSKWVIYHKNT